MKKFLSLLMIALFCFAMSACGADLSSGEEESSTTETLAQEYMFTQSDSDMFSQRDYESHYDETECIPINLNGASAISESEDVLVSDGVITITGEATYIVSGTLDNGSIVVDADDADKVRIVLRGADVKSETSAALYVVNGDKVFVTLASGTSNSLSNGGSFVSEDENNIDGAVFSKQDITFNGDGSLTVSSPAGHGIVCKDDIVFTGGTYNINSASHGIDANDSVRIDCGPRFEITAGKDGVHCENSDDSTKGFVYISDAVMNVKAEGDGISSGYFAQIENGDFNLLTGGGSANGTKSSSENYGMFMGGGPMGHRAPEVSYSETTSESSTGMKGIKATNSIEINGGSFVIDSADDGVHSDISVTINNGNFNISTGDDAIHAEEKLTIENGTISITESYEGLEALEIYINNGKIDIVSTDDGINAAGGVDNSGYEGGRDGMFGGPGYGGGPSPGGMNSSSDGYINICGGNIYINASGDGIDANGSLTISGGEIIVCGPTQGDTSTLDYDVSATITGGTFIGTGASGMAQTFNNSGQGVISVSVGNRTEGTEISVVGKDGKTIVSYTPELSFEVVIISTPDIASGEEYTVVIGELSEEFVAS